MGEINIDVWIVVVQVVVNINMIKGHVNCAEDRQYANTVLKNIVVKNVEVLLFVNTGEKNMSVKNVEAVLYVLIIVLLLHVGIVVDLKVYVNMVKENNVVKNVVVLHFVNMVKGNKIVESVVLNFIVNTIN